MTSSPVLIHAAAAHVRLLLEGDCSGHDWWHVERVWRMAAALAREEGADLLVVELAALLHDVDDWKLGGDAEGRPRRAAAWLEEQGVPSAVSEHVLEIIRTLSFKGAGVETPMRTLEGRVVQDADRLDAIGAIGIARAFAFGGAKGRLIHDPETAPERHQDFEAYRRKSGPSIHHFYEKLLLVKDRINTAAARRLAEGRHRFLETFLERFFREWDGVE